MPVLVITELFGSQADYDAIAEAVAASDELRAQDESDVHLMAVTGQGRFTVWEVWKDRETSDAFMAKLEPLIQKYGVRPAAEMQYVELHTAFQGQTQLYADQNRMQDA